MKLHHWLTFVNSIVLVLTAAFLFLVAFVRWFPLELVTTEGCAKTANDCTQHLDAVRVAAELGRLDFVSVALLITATVVALGGIFGFLYIRERSEMIAKERSEAVAKEWLRTEGSQVLSAELAKLGKLFGDMPDAAADSVAQMADNGDNTA